MKNIIFIFVFFLTSEVVFAGCTNATLKSDYSVGYYFFNNSTSCSGVGNLSFDGKGSVTVYAIGACNGSFVDNGTTYIGTYQVNSNCTASLNLGSNRNFYLTFDKLGKTGMVTVVSSGVTGNGTFIKK